MLDEDWVDGAIGVPNPVRMAAEILGRPAEGGDLAHAFGVPERDLWHPHAGSPLYGGQAGAALRLAAFLAQTRALPAFGRGRAEGVVRRRWRVALAVHGPALFPAGRAARGVAGRLRALDLDPDRDLAEIVARDAPGTGATPWDATQRLAEPCARAAARLAVAHRAGRADVAPIDGRGRVDPVDALAEACGEDAAQFLPEALEPLIEACEGDVLRGCAIAWTGPEGRSSSPNRAAAHAYTVLGVLRAGGAASHVVLRNPCGLSRAGDDPEGFTRLRVHPVWGAHLGAGLVPVPVDGFPAAFAGYALAT